VGHDVHGRFNCHWVKGCFSLLNRGGEMELALQQRHVRFVPMPCMAPCRMANGAIMRVCAHMPPCRRSSLHDMGDMD
jgi:hypothetical protein